jgi:lipopolysaccharide biosynthesis glycosyltransferase
VLPKRIRIAKQRIDRMVVMHRRLHRRYVGPMRTPRGPWTDTLPTRKKVAEVEKAALGATASDPFITTIARTGDLSLAAVAACRTMLRQGTLGQARTYAQVMQREPATAVAGDVSRALVAMYDLEPERAWQLLSANDPARVISMAAVETFRAGYRVAPAAARALLERLLNGDIDTALGGRAWREIAWLSFAAGDEDLAAAAIDRATAAAADKPEILSDLPRLQRWLGRRERRAEPAATDRISVAVLDDQHPRRNPPEAAATRTAADTRALVAALAEHGIRLAGDPKLVALAADGRAGGSQPRAGSGQALSLYSAGRDATSYADVPQGTWLLVTGPLPRRLLDVRADLPYDARYRPIFVCVEILDATLLTPDVVAQLRQYGPVGCRTWNAYYLLRAARVPAFFAASPGDAPLRAVTAAIAAGKDEDAVYQTWRDACEPQVAQGIARDKEVAGPPKAEFDIAAACRQVRDESVVIERVEAGRSGPEVALEMSLDGNWKDKMVVVLDSIERRSSRPLRLHVLCRDHDDSDFRRMAELFPTVSFHWLPTDHVDYGDLSGMIGHITVATMDRLLLPDVLPEVDRIIHHDLDAVCLADIAELADVDLSGHAVAACTSPRARYRSGLTGFEVSARRLREDGFPEQAEELLQRTHLRHEFDFDAFNAGVMVLDLARMRADGFCRWYIPFAQRFGLNDQAVMNAYAGADRLHLDPEWNWCPRIDDMGNPKIAHWSGPVKPWSPQWVSGRELWQEAERLAAERTGRLHASVPAK